MEPTMDGCEEQQVSFPLEEATSHLSVVLSLLQTAQDQWMGEKESLLREIERLRLENRTLRMEMRICENLDRNSSLNEPYVNRQNNHFLLAQDAGQVVSLSGATAPLAASRRSSCSTSGGGGADYSRIGSSRVKRAPETPDLSGCGRRTLELGSDFEPRNSQRDQVSPPGSQNCRVRRIKLEEEHSDHEPLEKRQKLIKFREVGRSAGKHSQREGMEAFECTECSKFYKAINNSKIAGSQGLCKHQKQNHLLQGSGRHRYKYPPLKSPPGYWDLDDI